VLRGVIKAVMWVTFAVFFVNNFLLWMPLESHIVTSGRFAPEEEYNTPIELKGRIFYVTVDEKRNYQTYMMTFFVCLTIVAVGVGLGNLTFERKR
jgi:hypothetical protein